MIRYEYPTQKWGEMSKIQLSDEAAQVVLELQGWAAAEPQGPLARGLALLKLASYIPGGSYSAVAVQDMLNAWKLALSDVDYEAHKEIRAAHNLLLAQAGRMRNKPTQVRDYLSMARMALAMAGWRRELVGVYGPAFMKKVFDVRPCGGNLEVLIEEERGDPKWWVALPVANMTHFLADLRLAGAAKEGGWPACPECWHVVTHADDCTMAGVLSLAL